MLRRNGMPIIQWNSNLSVNIEEIDTQHRRLVALINTLNDSMKQGKGKEVLGSIIGSLSDYTVKHFATEERYFEQFKYPERIEHSQKHLLFVQRVSEFRKGFENGQIGLSISVMNFLGNWLKEHIMGSDKKYAPFLAQQRVR
jgi:hemerythrin